MKKKHSTTRVNWDIDLKKFENSTKIETIDLKIFKKFRLILKYFERILVPIFLASFFLEKPNLRISFKSETKADS